MVDRINQHNAASLKYPLRDDKTQKTDIPLVLWDEAFASDTSSAKDIQCNSCFDAAKKSSADQKFDFGGLSEFGQAPVVEDVPVPLAKPEVQSELKVAEEAKPEVQPELNVPAEVNPKVATCDFETHPNSCDEPAIELPKPPESKYCDFDTHPKSCDDDPVAPDSIKTYIKEGDTLGKYAKSLYGTTSPDVLKALAEANPDAVKTVKDKEGKVDYRLAFDPKHLKELSLPYVIETSKATYATNDAFMPE